jgi:hypothetical protein
VVPTRKRRTRSGSIVFDVAGIIAGWQRCSAASGWRPILRERFVRRARVRRPGANCAPLWLYGRGNDRNWSIWNIFRTRSQVILVMVFTSCFFLQKAVL